MDFNNLFLYFAGLSVAFSYDDVSYKKTATQSHTWIGLGYDASNAVDGHTDTCMRTKPIGLIDPDKTVWWKVDLGRVYNIYSINILFKIYDAYETRQRGRFAGFSVFVSNTGNIQESTLCYKDGLQLPPTNFTYTCPMIGRYVIYYNERLVGVTYPAEFEIDNVITELCEVTIYGCNNSGEYGNNCNIPCPTNCKDNVCHIQNGTCYSCQPGWMGTTCSTRCSDGWYGILCSQQCVGHCKDGTTCNHVTGQCDKGCDVGWIGSLCDRECAYGTYGYECVHNCTGHCLNNYSCNKQTGHCDNGCNPGYTNSYCSKVCPFGFFGMDCRELCTGHCIRDEACDHVSGICLNGCQDGYIGTHCNISCREGYYGRHCSNVCPFTCETCRHTDGGCTCKKGWTGPRCNAECIQSYGENCQFPCSHCVNHTCDRFNGSCLYGCKDEKKCVPDLANLRIVDAALMPWIVGFSVSLLINVIVISANLLKLWRTMSKVNPDANQFCCWRSKFGTNQSETNDGVSHYQELSVSKGHNTYQTLTRK